MGLARQLARQRCRDEARSMLAEIYSWFSEGFDIIDLIETKRLLDDLEPVAFHQQGEGAMSQIGNTASGFRTRTS